MTSTDIQMIFPVSLKRMALSEISKAQLVSQFTTNFDQGSWFPSFLREQGLGREVYEIADLEWNLSQQVSVKDLPKKRTPTREAASSGLRLNPLMKVCPLTQSVPELNFEAGLYVFCGNSFLKLNSDQAHILDQLEDGLNPEQSLVSNLEKNLEALYEHGVILDFHLVHDIA